MGNLKTARHHDSKCGGYNILSHDILSCPAIYELSDLLGCEFVCQKYGCCLPKILLSWAMFSIITCVYEIQDSLISLFFLLIWLWFSNNSFIHSSTSHLSLQSRRMLAITLTFIVIFRAFIHISSFILPICFFQFSTCGVIFNFEHKVHSKLSLSIQRKFSVLNHAFNHFSVDSRK